MPRPVDKKKVKQEKPPVNTKPVHNKNPHTNAISKGQHPKLIGNFDQKVAEAGGGGGSSGGGSSSGGSSDNSSGGSGNIDYSKLFSFFGMTPDMIKHINRYMAQYMSSGMDESTAQDLIVGMIRGGQIGANYSNGMSWYNYTYQGISYGMANGLVDSSDPERSYRAYVNTVNQFYNEYFGRDATTQEVLSYMQGGVSADRVGAQLKGQSYAQAYENSDSNAMGYSWNALMGAFGSGPLTQDQANAIGEAQTGYSTPLGDQLNKQLQTATLRLQTLFKGTLASPADLQKGASGLKAPSLAGEVTPDTGPI